MKIYMFFHVNRLSDNKWCYFNKSVSAGSTADKKNMNYRKYTIILFETVLSITEMLVDTFYSEAGLYT